MFRQYEKSNHQIQTEKRIEHLNSEIAMYQSRLHGMGLDGDCAYERALIKVYNGLLAQRNLELENIRTVLPDYSLMIDLNPSIS